MGIKKGTEKVCPVCGGRNIQYNDVEVKDDSLEYKCVCIDCEAEFKEFFLTVYDGYAIEDENGNEKQFDEIGNILS